MINNIINKVSKKIERGTCEVEDLLLITPFYFSEKNHFVPFKKPENLGYLNNWIHYINLLFDKGPNHLVEIAKYTDDSNVASIIVSIIASMKSEISINYLSDLMKYSYQNNKLSLLMCSLSEFNLLASFKDSPPVSQSTRSDILNLISEIINSNLFEQDKDIALCLLSLRSIGNQHSIDLIKTKHFQLNYPYENVVKIVIKEIKKRL